MLVMQSFDGFDVEVHFVADVGKQEDGHQIARAAQDAFGGSISGSTLKTCPTTCDISGRRFLGPSPRGKLSLS